MRSKTRLGRESAWLSPGSVRAPYLRRNIFLALLLPLVGLMGMTTPILSASTAGIIIVCLAGPPQCD